MKQLILGWLIGFGILFLVILPYLFFIIEGSTIGINYPKWLIIIIAVISSAAGQTISYLIERKSSL